MSIETPTVLWEGRKEGRKVEEATLPSPLAGALLALTVYFPPLIVATELSITLYGRRRNWAIKAAYSLPLFYCNDFPLFDVRESPLWALSTEELSKHAFKKEVMKWYGKHQPAPIYSLFCFCFHFYQAAKISSVACSLSWNVRTSKPTLTARHQS